MRVFTKQLINAYVAATTMPLPNDVKGIVTAYVDFPLKALVPFIRKRLTTQAFVIQPSTKPGYSSLTLYPADEPPVVWEMATADALQLQQALVRSIPC